VTLRSQSGADHAFAAVDLSKAYRSTDRSRPERDTPWAKTVVREFVFVRPLETLVVFDRLEAQDGAGVTAANVRKTFLLHLEVAPTAASGGTVVATNGDQTLKVTTLLPTTPLAYRTVAEGGAVGQQRVEITTSGEAQTHFLNVLQARGSAESDLQASVADTGATFELALTHPTKGSAKIVFAKGMTSAGGSVQVGAAAPVALPSDVQRIEVTDAGPVWCTPGACS
jgi:hypothetical protein